MTRYTFEEKQQALDEAHELMMSDAEKLKSVKNYVNSNFYKNINPILNESELNLLIGLAEKGLGDEELREENINLRGAIMMSLELHKWNNNESAEILEKVLEDNP
ncbi:hypothetical protein ACXYMX_00335 [Sporosarcina sp. CAU 1771]